MQLACKEICTIAHFQMCVSATTADSVKLKRYRSNTAMGAVRCAKLLFQKRFAKSVYHSKHRTAKT